MRWWASVAVHVGPVVIVGLAACHRAAPPASAAARPEAAGCKVSSPVCDPRIPDELALGVVQARCAGCHAEGGPAAHPLLDLAALRDERANLALRLAGCEMPPDATPLPADERARLIGWGACAPVESAK